MRRRHVASSDNDEEIFSGVQIDTDGEIAPISFDQVCRSNNKVFNDRWENWLLFRKE